MEATEATRVRQSAMSSAAPDVMATLAHDASVTVRATLALNRAAPPEVNAVLSGDADERVRALLGRKLAALVPTLTDQAQLMLRQQTLQIVTRLVADEADRVRATVAEAIKSLPDAPRDLILRLAHDPAIMVSAPIILFSPVLTSQDLIALIIAAPSPETITTVARRAGIDPAVADAIVAAADSDAVAALLENPSAQIKEETLDALIARAGNEMAWHEPLVRRPNLPQHSARALAEIVAANLLEVLSQRVDLSPEFAADLRDRLRQQCPALPDAAASSRTRAASAVESAWRHARAMRDSGQLTDRAFIDVARRGDPGLLGAMLALRSNVPAEVVDRAMALRTSKGLTALAWRGSLSMQVAQALQIVLGRLPPDQVITAHPGGGYPLSQQEMRWQLEFLSRAPR